MRLCVFLVAFCAWSAKAAATGVQGVDQQFRHDYTFGKNLGVWMKFHLMPVQWESAVLRCHHEGAILASPLDETFSELLSTIMTYHGVTAMFTGISNTYAPNEFQSMEGVPISDMFLRWAVEPNLIISNTTCLTMNSDGNVTAVSCSERHPFACIKKEGAKVLNDCGTADLEYKLSKETGSCYKMYKEKQNWSEAFERCAIDGGHLAVVNSEAEAKIVYDLSIDALPKTGGNDFVILGYRAWGPQRTWITVQGQSLNDAGYAKWYTGTGEPNNFNKIESCGGLILIDLQHGILNDIPCHGVHKYFFICEIESQKKRKPLTFNNIVIF